MFCLFVFLVCYYGILYQSHVFFPPSSVITPDPNFSSVAPNGAVGGGPHRPPLPRPGYPAWPHAPYRGPLYRPGSFYRPPPPPMYRGYYPPPRPAPPPFHPAAGGPPFPPRGAVPPMPRPSQEADGRGIHQTGKPDVAPQHSQAGPFRPDQMAPHQPINQAPAAARGMTASPRPRYPLPPDVRGTGKEQNAWEFGYRRGSTSYPPPPPASMSRSTGAPAMPQVQPQNKQQLNSSNLNV